MTSFRLAIIISAVFATLLISSTVNGKLISKCIGAYAQECSDQESPTGIEKCCLMMVDFYNTDADCLCSIYEYIGINNEYANQMLTKCGANTEGFFSCGFNPQLPQPLRSSFGFGESTLSPSNEQSSDASPRYSPFESAGTKTDTDNRFNTISGLMSLGIFLLVG